MSTTQTPYTFPGNDGTTTNRGLERRGAWAIIPDFWLQVLWRKLRIEAELAARSSQIFALAGEAYRVGREDRGEYGEPHAGRIFTRRALNPDETGIWPRAATAGELATRTFKSVSQEIFAGSTGEGHTLSDFEFESVMREAYDATAGRVPFLAGLIVQSTRSAIEAM